MASNSTPAAVERFYCSVCDLMTNSKLQFQQHEVGRIHLRNSEKLGSKSVNEARVENAKNGLLIPFVQQGKANSSDAPMTFNGSAANGRREQPEQPRANFCAICCIQMTSSVQAQAHFTGGKHKHRAQLVGGGCPSSGDEGVSKSKKVRLEVCQVCNVQLNSPVAAKIHYDSPKHQKKAEKKQAVANAMNKRKAKGPIPSNPTYCRHCEKAFNSQKQLDAHNAGGKHKARMEQLGQGQDRPMQQQQQQRNPPFCPPAGPPSCYNRNRSGPTPAIKSYFPGPGQIMSA